MAQFRPYGPSGQPDTCLWCGKKLHFHYIYDWSPSSLRPAGRVAPAKKGRYHDGYFCSIGCGYQYAVTILDKVAEKRSARTKKG